MAKSKSSDDQTTFGVADDAAVSRRGLIGGGATVASAIGVAAAGTVLGLTDEAGGGRTEGAAEADGQRRQGRSIDLSRRPDVFDRDRRLQDRD